MQTCAICCEDILNKDDGYKTPCNHYMHNTCLTHWLLLKNTCPICRHNICGPTCNEDNNEPYYEEEIEEDQTIENIEVNFNNEIYTSSYDTILTALKEIIYCLTLEENEATNFRLSNNWIFDETKHSFTLKLNTRKDIINIIVNADYYHNSLYLDIQFNMIFKYLSKYKNKLSIKKLLISNFSLFDLPTRINCY